jgi:Tfp pilus assembly protein PilF
VKGGAGASGAGTGGAAAEGALSGRRAGWIVLGLLLATAVAYEPVRHNGFISFDDGVYLTENPHVRRGLDAEAFAWAFQAGYAGNWHPLTWLSHMADVALWGLDPVPHHLTNVALHAASAVMLFLLLRVLTRRDGASAFVAAVFAVHPLHVESVAWAAERKDVLSALLGLVSLWAWVRWRLGGRRAYYGLSLAAFAAGLTAKPMLVSVPVLLVLLELLPVLPGHVRRGGAPRERLAWLASRLLPHGVLALASAWVTVYAQSAGGAVTGVATLPVGARLANAVTSCATYLGLAVAPRDLAIVYPYPIGGVPAGKLVVSLVVVGAVSAWAWWRRRTQSWVAFGWLWYLVTLLPVVGIVQIGQQAMADRYTYLPLIGVSIAAGMELSDRLDRRRVLLLVLALMLVWIGLTRRQVALWKDDLTLFGHAVRVTERNYIARDRLGNALADAGRHEQAVAEYEAAIAIRPGFADPYNNLGLSLEALGRPEEAVARYDQAIARDPELAAAHANRGNALDTLGRLDEAEQAFLAALGLEPDAPRVHNSLGVTLAREGRLDEAVAAFREAIRLDPDYGGAWLNFGRALQQAGRMEEAIEAVERGARLSPGRQDARAALESLRQRDATPAGARPDGG